MHADIGGKSTGNASESDDFALKSIYISRVLSGESLKSSDSNMRSVNIRLM